MQMEKLKQLAKTNKYVFHGSADGNLKVLIPKQAKSFNKNYHEPAVWAADNTQQATFMAVLGSRKTGGWSVKDEGRNYDFFIHRSDMERAKAENWKGFVYVFSRVEFKHNDGPEWYSTESVKPLLCMPVSLNDLPRGIRLMSEYEFKEHFKQVSKKR